jgi:kynurenine formamidase
VSLPSRAEVFEYFESLSNWGRWGPDDELGTVNFITPESRLRGVAAVQHGLPVSCALDILANVHQSDDMLGSPTRVMIAAGVGDVDRRRGAMEYLGMVFHGRNITHLDALSHSSWDGRLYNNRSFKSVTAANGARVMDVTGVRNGLMTRGVLLDIARLYEVPFLDPTHVITPDVLDAACQSQGVTIASGDAVLLRTGYGYRRRTIGPASQEEGWAGWHASTLPWIHSNEVAIVASDVNNEQHPSGYEGLSLPIHSIGIPRIGLWLLDNCDLEELSETCERLSQWDFLMSIAPLSVKGATGSPINPIALL